MTGRDERGRFSKAKPVQHSAGARLACQVIRETAPRKMIRLPISIMSCCGVLIFIAGIVWGIAIDAIANGRVKWPM